MKDINKGLKTSLDKICKSIKKDYGNESINFLGNNEVEAIPRLKSGDVALDDALGGGWPIGRVVELFGPESSGKSTLCYHAIAEAQKLWPDIPVALVDVEYSFDPVYAQNLGVQVESLLVSQPDTGTDALNILIDIVNQGVKLVVVDSVAALLPKEESDAGLDQNQMGLQARLMSKGLRKLNQASGRHKSLVMFTNQIRSKIGVMYGNPETTPGGNALKFYASVRVRLSQTGKTIEGTEIVACKHRANVVKNKTAPPFRTVDLIIRFGEGIDSLEGVINAAIEKDVVEKKGSWFSLFGEQLGQGRPVIREALEKDEELLEKVKAELEKCKDVKVVKKEETDEVTESQDEDGAGNEEEVVSEEV